jgi:hypothetical protein
MTDTENKTCSLSTPGDSPTPFVADKNTPPLTGDELASAMEELSNVDYVSKFKKTDRNYADPPIHLQQFGLFSFIPAKGATPNKNGIFGFAKQRGNYASEEEASERAELIIREVDSTHTIFHTYIGRPFPLTISDKYSAETSEVDIRRETTEAVSTTIKDKKAEDKRVMEEIKERERLLMEDVSGERDKEELDLDEYITLNVKKAQLSWTYMEHLTKLKEVRNLILKARVEVKKTDVENPTFRDSFFDKYHAARTKAGVNTTKEDLQTGFMRYLGGDISLPGIDDNLVGLNELINNDFAQPETMHISEFIPADKVVKE